MFILDCWQKKMFRKKKKLPDFCRIFSSANFHCNFDFFDLKKKKTPFKFLADYGSCIALTPGRFCEVASGALQLLPLQALVQNVQDLALLKKSQKIVVFLLKKRKKPAPTSSKHEVLHEKLKTVLPVLILIFF